MTAKYGRMQLKRAMRIAPQTILVTVLLALAVALTGAVGAGAGQRKGRTVRIGVTGDTEGPLFRLGFGLISELDSSRFAMSFEIMDEEEARRGILSGDLMGYVLVPEGFAQSLMDGTRYRLTYVENGSGGLNASMMEEIAASVSRLLLGTENATYGVQRYVRQNQPDLEPYDESMLLFDKYISAILDRTELFGLEEIGLSQGLSLLGGLVAGLSTFVLMLWALAATPFFSGRSPALGELMHAHGVSYAAQVLLEYAAFVALYLAGTAVLVAAGAVSLRFLNYYIPELAALEGERFFLLLVRAAPVLCLTAATAFLLFELAPGGVGGTLLQLLFAVSQGYAAGCLYPAAFLPDAVRAIGRLTPAGTAMRVMGAAFRGDTDKGALLAALIWTAALLALSGAVRYGKRGRDA